jgi:hypothetical protein
MIHARFAAPFHYICVCIFACGVEIWLHPRFSVGTAAETILFFWRWFQAFLILEHMSNWLMQGTPLFPFLL